MEPTGSVGDLAVSETATLTITANVSAGTSGQTLVNDASVFTSDQPDPVLANNTATASITVPIADLSLTKTVNDANPSAGNTITYTVTAGSSTPAVEAAGGGATKEAAPTIKVFQAGLGSEHVEARAEAREKCPRSHRARVQP